MPQNGGLRKRKRRNLAKVKGRFGHENESGSNIRLNLNSSKLRDLRRESESSSLYKNSGRVTRNPSFHANGNTDKVKMADGSISHLGESSVSINIDIFKGPRERDHLLDKCTMTRLKQLLWLGQASGSFPWKWNAQTNRIDKWGAMQETIWWYQWIVVMVQTVFLTVFHIYVFWDAIRKAQTYRTAFQASFSTLWYSYNLMLNGYMYFYKESTMAYINTLLQFNKENVGKYVIHLDGYRDGGDLIINGAMITNVVQICISVSFFVIMPYQPWYLFSYIYPKPWYWLIPFAYHEFMLVGQVITIYLLISWLIVAHNNTLNFWLREIHNHNDSDYTIDTLRDPKVAVEMYRKLQILCKTFNEFVAPNGLPAMKWVIATAIIPCGYVLIRSMNHLFWDEFPGILTYPLGVIDCATVAFVMMTMTAEVHGLSQEAYDAKQDTFTGRELFGTRNNETQNVSNQANVRNGSETRIRLNSSKLRDTRRQVECVTTQPSSKIYSRVTRDPSFHNDPKENPEHDIEGRRNSLENNSESDLLVGLGPFDKRKIVEGSIKDRECFLDKDAMDRLSQLICLGIYTGSFPWKWNSKTNRIERWGPLMEKVWWVQWFCFTIQTCALTGFQLYSFLHAVQHAKTYRTAFQSSFSFLWYSYCVILNINLYYYKEAIRSYLNTLMHFNHEYVSKYLIHLNDYQDGGRWIISCAVITNTIQVLISASLFCVMPYQPWYLFSYIYPKPWYWLIPGAFQEFMVVGQVIASYMLISWMIVAHNNTLSFWLSETHNHNDSDYTIDELRHPKTAIETYRSIQVLQNLFNDCAAPLGIPFIKIVMSTAMVPCGYVLIRSMNHLFLDEFPGILTYPLGVIDCATAGWVILTMSAEVYDLSAGFLMSWRQTRHRELKRFLMSCPSLKIWVGRFYFLTKTTTITFFKVIFDAITDCIVMFP